MEDGLDLSCGDSQKMGTIGLRTVAKKRLTARRRARSKVTAPRGGGHGPHADIGISFLSAHIDFASP
jgi:hypothetical protein